MIESIDPSAPNLDGDFKAILQVLKQKDKKTAYSPPKLPLLEENANEDSDIVEAALVEDFGSESSPKHTDKSVKIEDVEPLRQELFNAVKADSFEKCRALSSQLESKGYHLSSKELRSPDDNANVLHHAMMNNSMKTAEFFITVGDEHMLMQEYDISVKGVQSKKTSLHLLAEQSNIQLSRAFLKKLPSGHNKDKFLQKTVLTEMEGQRPRHLSSIHIAALMGNTEMVELLVDLGISVNAKNNKNDTPILWAARNNHIPTVRRLIQLGADLHCENDKGSTPLYWAVRYGFAELVELLIVEGNANIHQKRKLGLVSPLVLAAALGYDKIVEILLKHGADPNIRVTGGQTALQLAACYDNDGVIEILLNHDANIDEADDSGNTPLMYAANGSHMASIGKLIENHANMDCKNKMGRTIWDFAMEQEDDNLLRILFHFYRGRLGKRIQKTFMLPTGRTPLHVAALKGDVDKIKCLFALGADPKSIDQSGNTYFHIAARDNGIKVIETFLNSIDINQQNSDGETALHLAVKDGHKECVQHLLQKAKLDIRDKAGSTVLHLAARSNQASAELINMIVDTIVKTANWSLVDAADERGNTALHIACRKGRTDILGALGNLNPMKVNKDGDTPLHVAAKSGNGDTLEALIEIFSQPGKGLYIDRLNMEGESALHICAKQGDTERVSLLIQYGADLALQNNDGNTVLHELAEQSVLEPYSKDAHLDVYHTIVNDAPRWWCIQREYHIPDEDSEIFQSYQRDAILFLTSEIFNQDGLDVVGFAASVGAIDIVSAILNTPDVYRFVSNSGYVFDVTNLAPETATEDHGRQRKQSKYSSVGVLESSSSVGYKASNQCFLDIVVKVRDQVLATRILDVTPVKQMINNYWSAYQWIYGLLMIIHIVYMGCYTAYSIPILTTYYNNSQNAVVNNQPNVWPMALFLSWPILILMFEVYYILARLVRYCKTSQGGKTSGGKNWLQRLRKVNLLNSFFGILSHLVALTFVALVVFWFALYALAHDRQVYSVAMVLILGWMFTIAFTKGFETVHAFSIMLKYIVMKDMTRFLFIYSFVLLGFAFAFHALLQVAPVLTMTGWDSFLATFTLMLGLGDVLAEDFVTDYTAAGGNSLFVQIVYLVYITLSTIILLNLLIAMMSDTYSAVKAREGTTWRVGSVKLALDVERSLPFIRKFFKLTGILENDVQFDSKSGRWLMTIPWAKGEARAVVEVNEMVKSMERLETRVTQLYHDLARQIETIAAKVERNDKQHAFARMKKISSLSQATKSLNARPKTGRGLRV